MAQTRPTECVICFEALYDNDRSVIVLPCGRMFHTKCAFYKGELTHGPLGMVCQYRCQSTCSLCRRDHVVRLRIRDPNWLGQCTNSFVKYDLGNVGDAYGNQDIDDIALGFVAFSVGLNCELAMGEDNVPSGTIVKPKLKLRPSRILAAAATHQLNYFNLNTRCIYLVLFITYLSRSL